MKDQFALLGSGVVCALLAWVSWRWWGDYLTWAVFVIVLIGYAVDNGRLRGQVRTLLAERDRRQQSERQRLLRALIALRDQRD